MTKLSIIIGLLLQVILLMSFYFLIDNRMDKLEQADQNIIQGVNSFIGSLKSSPPQNEKVY